MAKKVLQKKGESADQALSWAIEATGVAEVIRASADEGSVKVLYRVREKRTWLAILEYALARANGWSAHVCQQYFMRGGKLVYGWNFILQSAGGLEEAVGTVAALLKEGSRVIPKVVARGPVESFPLVGASKYRTAKIQFDPRLPGPSRGGPSHKGAYNVRGE